MFPVVMLAGGLGTRVKSVTNDAIPKTLIEINGRPFLDIKMEGLISQGANDVVLLTGFKGEQVEQRVASQSNYGIKIKCIPDGPVQLGTAGAVRRALNQLPETFWITWADSYLQFDVERAEKQFQSDNVDALMTVLRNEDKYEPSNVSVVDGLVAQYDKPAVPGTHKFIDYGMLLFKKSCFTRLAPNEPNDLSTVLQPLIANKSVSAYEVEERFHDIGTPEAIAETEAYFA